MRNETQVAEQIICVQVKGVCYENVAFGKLVGLVLYFFSVREVFSLHKMNTHRWGYFCPSLCLFASFSCETIERISIKFGTDDGEN
jgi:hypothetical protein